jgi:sugar/nucleoside kinase (ribokinase family)
MGPGTVLVKRGEYGVIQFNSGKMFAMRAYPLEVVIDPSGSGDTFAGGFIGFLARYGRISEPNPVDSRSIRQRAGIVRGRTLFGGAIDGFNLGRNQSALPNLH